MAMYDFWAAKRDMSARSGAKNVVGSNVMVSSGSLSGWGKEKGGNRSSWMRDLDWRGMTEMKKRKFCFPCQISSAEMAFRILS